MRPASRASGCARGLGTRDEAEAARLQDELNVLLGDTKYHDPATRPEAERRFDPASSTFSSTR